MFITTFATNNTTLNNGNIIHFYDSTANIEYCVYRIITNSGTPLQKSTDVVCCAFMTNSGTKCYMITFDKNNIVLINQYGMVCNYSSLFLNSAGSSFLTNFTTRPFSLGYLMSSGAYNSTYGAYLGYYSDLDQLYPYFQSSYLSQIRPPETSFVGIDFRTRLLITGGSDQALQKYCLYDTNLYSNILEIEYNNNNNLVYIKYSGASSNTYYFQSP